MLCILYVPQYILKGNLESVVALFTIAGSQPLVLVVARVRGSLDKLSRALKEGRNQYKPHSNKISAIVVIVAFSLSKVNNCENGAIKIEILLVEQLFSSIVKL